MSLNFVSGGDCYRCSPCQSDRAGRCQTVRAGSPGYGHRASHIAIRAAVRGCQGRTQYRCIRPISAQLQRAYARLHNVLLACPKQELAIDHAMIARIDLLSPCNCVIASGAPAAGVVHRLNLGGCGADVADVPWTLPKTAGCEQKCNHDSHNSFRSPDSGPPLRQATVKSGGASLSICCYCGRRGCGRRGRKRCRRKSERGVRLCGINKLEKTPKNKMFV